MRTQGLAFSSALVRQFRALCSVSRRASSQVVAEECIQLASLFGAPGFVSLLVVLLEDFEPAKHSHHQFKLKILEQIFLEPRASVPEVTSLLCQALLRIPDSPFQYFKSFTEGLELPFKFQVEFGLAVCQAPSILLWKEEGLWFLRDTILRGDQSNHSLPPDVVHSLLCCAASSKGLLAECTSKIHNLATSYPSTPSTLWPFLKNSEINWFQDPKVQNSSISKMTSQLDEANSLAGVMEEHGYSCSSSEVVFQAVISQFGLIDELAVAKVIGMMARTHTGLDDSGMMPSLTAVLGNAGGSGNGGGNVSTWNADLVVDVLRVKCPNLVWTQVVERLDHDGFHIPDHQGFILMMRCLIRGLGTEPFPLQSVLSKIWSNALGQISFLNHAVTMSPDVFSFDNSRRKLAVVEGLQGGRLQNGNGNQAWISLDLAEILCKLGDNGHIGGVRQILETPMKNHQEVLVLLMASVRSAWGLVQSEVCSSLIPIFLLGHTNGITVLHALWEVNKEEVVKAMVELYLKDAAHIPRILDVCQELKSLTVVLDSSNYAFASELAALASRREYLNLEKWLKDKISLEGLSFVEAVLSFLDAKLVQHAQQGQPAQGVGRVNLSVETLALFLRVLHMNTSVFPADLATEISHLESKAMKLYPQLQGLHEQGEQAEVFASDIENEANSYFQKIYSEQTRLDDVIQMLKLYKSSTEQREQEVFACMVHNLFDEYRFFPKYPDKELNITAVLFGQLIHHQLVSSITLGIALRYVLDALRKPSDSNMFNFGVKAIRQFKSELPGWPQYCQHVLEIPQVGVADPSLVQFIEAALREQGLRRSDSQTQESHIPRGSGELPVGDSNGKIESSQIDNGVSEDSRVRETETASDQLPVSHPQVEANGISLERPPPTENGTHTNPPESTSQPAPPSAPSLAAINAQTLEMAAQEYCTFSEPPEKIKDKVSFVFNNLSPSNMTEKIQLLRETVGDEHIQWLANYVVVKRAAQEVNFHPLYLRLVEEMDNKSLVDHIIQTTYHYVKVLLEKDRIKHEMSDRSLLKNLGSWLGQLTIAKNKPVRQKDMDLKAIMFEAYEKGKMVAVIPFVHKVLEQGKESKVYGPSNPWIKGILTLLAEIYRLEGLKMNLTFEIEMIFKDFNLNIDEIPASKSLDGIQRDNNSNPDFYDTRNATPSSQPPANVPKPGLSGPADVSSQPSPTESAGVGVSPQMVTAPGIRGGGLDSVNEPVPPGPRVGANMQSSFKQGMVPSMNASVGGVQPPVVATDAASILSALAGNLHQLVTINPTLSALAQTVPLKRLISVGIDRAIYEIITPVVERSVMIACTTTKELVTKDFAMEPDEQKLRKAAHLMVSSLSGSLALVTCKEPLRVSLQSQLKEVLQDVLDPGLLDQTILTVITDNLDLGCTIIEKASTDKAIKEVDERLLPYYQSRQKARAANTPFYDMSIFTRGSGRFPASLPESLRPKPGQLNATQTRVYDDFARIPRPNQHLLRLAGIAESPVTQIDQPDSMLPPYKPTNLADRYAHWQARLDAILSKENPNIDYSQSESSSEINATINELAEVVLLGQNRDDVVTGIAEKLFIHMYDRPTRLAVTALCAALSMLKNSGFNRLANHVTTWYCQISQDESRRFNQIVADGLIRANLMVFTELDLFLARCVSNHCGPHLQSVDFICYLLHQYIMVEHLIRASDLASTLEVLRKLALQPPVNERIIRLIDQVRNVQKDADPEGLRDQVAALFDNWAKVVHADPTEKNITACVEHFIRRGLLKGDDITSRFFRICAELSVLHCVNTEVFNQQQQQVGDGRMSYVMIDSFVKLVVTLLEVLKGGVQGLRKILEIIVLVLYRDHDDRGIMFNSRPYFRIFYGLFQEMLPSDLEEPGTLDVLGVLASALVSCRPQRGPGFTFSWLELVSHHLFMPRLLKYPDRRGWSYFRALFMGLLLFMQPYLRHAELGDTLRVLYKGVMRVMLVLLHDFPEFLCDYHVELCNVIPPSCVQMRNLILSAFPSHMRLPDPFTPNLKVDLLPDINKEPKIFPDVSQLLPVDLKNGIDQYIKSHGPALFLDNLPQRLKLSPEAQKVEGTAYNVTIMNCVVLYTGILAIRAVRNTNCGSLVQYGPAMDIFHKLAKVLDTEGRYLFLNAIANQLRFPNSHTHYFSCVLLVLFLEAGSERVLQEQITRVLLERLIVHRPHPWGLLITFIELIKNKRYSFWDLGITRCAPEIGQLFDSVARSCLPAPPEGMAQDENGVAVQSAERALDPGS